MYGIPNGNPNYPAPKPKAVDAMAEFLAKGGKITQVEEGVKASDYTNRRMRDAENQVSVHNAYYR